MHDNKKLGGLMHDYISSILLDAGTPIFYRYMANILVFFYDKLASNSQYRRLGGTLLYIEML